MAEVGLWGNGEATRGGERRDDITGRLEGNTTGLIGKSLFAINWVGGRKIVERGDKLKVESTLGGVKEIHRIRKNLQTVKEVSKGGHSEAPVLTGYFGAESRPGRCTKKTFRIPSRICGKRMTSYGGVQIFGPVTVKIDKTANGELVDGVGTQLLALSGKN